VLVAVSADPPPNLVLVIGTATLDRVAEGVSTLPRSTFFGHRFGSGV